MRFLDLLMAWEAAGSMPQDWAHNMVQLEKPAGSGHRTIGLTVFPLRVWSGLRSCYATRWEDENPCEAFWGAAGRPCERAAWTHSVMKAAAGARARRPRQQVLREGLPRCFPQGSEGGAVPVALL